MEDILHPLHILHTENCGIFGALSGEQSPPSTTKCLVFLQKTPKVCNTPGNTTKSSSSGQMEKIQKRHRNTCRPYLEILRKYHTSHKMPETMQNVRNNSENPKPSNNSAKSQNIERCRKVGEKKSKAENPKEIRLIKKI